MAIQRLSGALRNAARLDRSDARMMHIMNDEPVVRLTRYNIRTPEGKIVKLTVGEDSLKVNYLSKSEDGGYKSYMQKFIQNSSENINKKLAEIVKSVTKK